MITSAVNKPKITPVDTIVLAGGRTNAEMHRISGVTQKALIPIGGKAMLDYVVEALDASSRVGRVFVVGDIPKGEQYERVQSHGTIVENLLAGIEAADPLEKASRVLVVTCDIPFLISAAVNDFIRQATQSGADLCYPIISMESYNEQFADIKRTTLKLGEGEFTGGNIMLLNPSFIRRHQALVMRAFEARKNVFQIGRMLGPVLLARIILAQTINPSFLGIHDLEAGVSKMLGGNCSAKAIITRFPEICTDVDKPEDVREAELILGDGGATRAPLHI